MKRTWLVFVMLSITLAGAGSAGATLVIQDFENIPDQYLYYGGNQNLGGYLPGLNFSPQVTVLDRVRYGYNDDGYPPHSGDAVIFSEPEDYMRIDFLGFTSPYVEMRYTCASGHELHVEGYNAAGAVAAGLGRLGRAETSQIASASNGTCKPCRWILSVGPAGRACACRRELVEGMRRRRR